MNLRDKDDLTKDYTLNLLLIYVLNVDCRGVNCGLVLEEDWTTLLEGWSEMRGCVSEELQGSLGEGFRGAQCGTEKIREGAK